MNRLKFLTILVVGLFISNGILFFMIMKEHQGKEGPKNIIIKSLHFDKEQIRKYEVLIQKHRNAINDNEKLMRNLRSKLYLNLQNEPNQNLVDSFISKILLAGGIIKAFAEIENNKTYLKVLGFKMEIYNAAKGFSLDSSITDKLTPTMRKYVSSINDGGIFYIRDIKYSFPDGTIGIIPMYRVFLVKDDRRPFEFGM